MRRPLIAGNWKLNGTRDSAVSLASTLSSASNGLAAELLVCPSYPHIAVVADAIQGGAIALGAQDVSIFGAGAYTGDVSAAMLHDLGCQFVIIGHSERRALHAEDNTLLGQKVDAALAASLTPVFCVGESLTEREAEQTLDIIDQQMDGALDHLSVDQLAACVVAYEPVWAIGTGLSATPEQAQTVHAHIRQWLHRRSPGAAEAIRVLYGGSVKPDNAAALFSQADIDGALVGGASLNATDFLTIANAVA